MDKITLFRTIPRIVMGPGAIKQVGDEVKGLKAGKVMFVTDRGIVEAGLLCNLELIEVVQQTNIYC